MSTATASAKSLSYCFPIVEALLSDPDARALHALPTNPLGEGQMESLRALTSVQLWGDTYEGDTPDAARKGGISNLDTTTV